MYKTKLFDKNDPVMIEATENAELRVESEQFKWSFNVDAKCKLTLRLVNF